MPKMKDSGIRWIGEIPENWDVVRVKDAFTKKKAKAKQENPTVLSLARSAVKIRDISNNEGQLAENYSDYNPVIVDDLLLNTMDLISGDNCNISRVEGVISPAYANLRYKDGINPEFYNFYFKYQYWCKAFFAHGKGVSFENRWTLNNETLERFPIVLPPFEEQNKIADYLLKKCEEIDNLRSDIEKQISVLEDYKKSVITETVTKGLNPNVEMKDSRIDIIGCIPANWSMIRLKYLCTIQTGDSDTQDADVDGEYPFYVRSPIVERNKTYTFDGEGILVAGDGAGAGRVFHHAYGKYAVHQRVYRLANFKNVNSDFLFFYLQNLFTKQMDKGSAQSTVPSLRLPMLLNFIVCMPTLNEQEKIANYLMKKCTEIDAVIADKKAQLKTLEEYKKSLIYEYVTGKKEVPNDE